ncbi:MAG: hypothetical protein KBS41_01465 [Oscillospiraceae bacterium]|nr:hypothetical protein [Candidatus Equicaccousia limihippi]
MKFLLKFASLTTVTALLLTLCGCHIKTDDQPSSESATTVSAVSSQKTETSSQPSEEGETERDVWDDASTTPSTASSKATSSKKQNTGKTSSTSKKSTSSNKQSGGIGGGGNQLPIIPLN